MDVKQFNEFMKRCGRLPKVRYVTSTIHPGFKRVVAVTIHTIDESKEFTITNNSDENFDLNEAVNKYLVEVETIEIFME